MKPNTLQASPSNGPGLTLDHPAAIHVRRTGTRLLPDRSRVLVRPFKLTSEQRAVNLCARVMSLGEAEVCQLLNQVTAEFGDRHQQMRDLLNSRYEQVKGYLLTNQKL